MKRIFTLLVIVFTVMSIEIEAQKLFFDGSTYSTDPINPKSFSEELFQDVLLYKINKYMDSLGLEGYEAHEFFMEPAREHAIMMAENQNASLEGRGAYRTVRDRLIAAGGTGIGSELIARITIKISNEYISYDVLANQILDRWVTGKYATELFSQKNFFAGISGKIDEQEKKIYVSMYMGNFASFKPSQNSMAELTFPITTKTYGLKPYDDKICKKTGRRMPNIVDLQSGLSLNDQGQIVFKYNDLKKFRKFIKDNKDGLAVDIIQKAQFNNCNGENIADYSNINQGIMTKRIYAKKLYKNNLAQGEGRRNKVTKLEVVLGELPLGLQPEDVELNLMIIKNKSVCNNISQSWVDNKVYDFVPKPTLIPDTILPANVPGYAPTSTSTELRFRIPFEQGKYEYKPEDMQPVLAALNEPDFIINKIFISAYSSLEGSMAENAILQKKRAQSIVKALEKNQNASIVDSIITAPNLKDLQNDAKGTIYDEVCNMTLEEAVEYVNKRAKEMEFLLANHRYADVVIWVTYDIDGNKEQKYVVDQFNKAVASNQLNLALSIQKYIIKRVIEGRYNENAVVEMRIPQGKDYVGLNMNKIWLTQYVYLDPLDEEYLQKIDELNKLDNQNIYVEYNDILCETQLTDIDKEGIYDQLQNRINNLYNTPIRVDLVDALNIELQFQIMTIYKDSLGVNHPVVTKSLDKIKEIVKIDEITWETALKLASIFVNQGDYSFAVQLLEPFVTKENLPIAFYTTYATVCSKLPYKSHSNNFTFALEKISKNDPNMLCDLFSGDKFAIQTFINTRVKQLYCNTCKK